MVGQAVAAVPPCHALVLLAHEPGVEAVAARVGQKPKLQLDAPPEQVVVVPRGPVFAGAVPLRDPDGRPLVSP